MKNGPRALRASKSNLLGKDLEGLRRRTEYMGHVATCVWRVDALT